MTLASLERGGIGTVKRGQIDRWGDFNFDNKVWNRTTIASKDADNFVNRQSMFPCLKRYSEDY